MVVLTAVTLLTMPMTVDAIGFRFARGDTKSNASLNLSSGTWIERRYATPRRNTDCWVVSLSISSSFANNCAVLLPTRIATSMSFPKLSTASRYAALQRSEEMTELPMWPSWVNWLVEVGRWSRWRLLWSVWIWALTSLVTIEYADALFECNVGDKALWLYYLVKAQPLPLVVAILFNTKTLKNYSDVTQPKAMILTTTSMESSKKKSIDSYIVEKMR